MPLKVLLADDNITAQRMGSKILSDAGYTVVAVSNGASAMKKIASEKPELMILDVYMPGYTGLEVCEKVKGAAETARIPVLLTITSMEPFRPEDGDRVRADGVLTKPFEATDLLAVVRKLEEKLHPAEPDLPTTTEMAAVQDSSEPRRGDWKGEAGPAEEYGRPAEMSHEVGSAPVLGIEGLTLTPDAAPVLAVESSPAQLAEEGHPEEVPVIDLGLPTAAFGHVEAPVIEAPPELEFASAPRAGPIEVAPAAEFEPTMQAGAEPASVAQDSALATDPSDFMQFATRFGQEHPEDIPVGIVMEEPPHDDAMAAVHDAAAEPGPVAEPASFESEMRQAFESPSPEAVAPEPPAEPHSETGIDTQPIEIFPEPTPAPAVEIEAAAEPGLAQDELPHELVAQFAAEVEAAQREVPPEPEAAATAPAVTLDRQQVAEAVDRVLDRYKDELVAAILRELHS